MSSDQTCKFCGTSGLHWKQFNGKWRLFDAQEQMHRHGDNPLGTERDKEVPKDYMPNGDQPEGGEPHPATGGECPPIDANMTRSRLSQIANKLNVGPDGKYGDGYSRWRATNGTKQELLDALQKYKANDNKYTGSGGGEGDGNPLKMPDGKKLPNDMTAEDIAKMIDDALKAMKANEERRKPKHITITIKDEHGEKLELGLSHKQTPLLTRLIAARVPIMLVGPPGWGKSTAPIRIAKAMGLTFSSDSMSEQTPESRLMGFVDATSNYRRTSFRERIEYGGIHVIDEIDNANPNVVAATNTATANEYIGFPDGMIPKHPDCVIIATANTFGRGADRMFVGRQQLDAATLDRFVVIPWDADEALEREITLSIHPEAEPWMKIVQSARQACEKLKVRHIVSPRASYNGAKLLRQDITDVAMLKDMLIFKGLDDATRKRIEENMNA